jgi:hypothetical protein
LVGLAQGVDDALSTVRRRAEEHGPAVALLPDLRLADIIIWTA